ncbi:AMP-binding protein [Streptomyces cavernicola]|uniref:AMP-binding protein n=1 Tax=Streptomyces cavernicola TaxID=3043613 RepID=A0ABT6SDK9_9ACTN|nr:AMP-binding protein [Streptomyces sp. B-S-A6]MDI3405371.1 AMP-binding protein [Streptomyces sp. B-S-A6]
MTNLATALLEELDEFSARVAGGLYAHGVRPGDPVGLRVPDVPAYPALYFGVLRLGAIVVPAQGLAPGRRSRARLVFTAPPLLHEAGDDTTLIQVGPDFLDQLRHWPLRSDVAPRADDDPAVRMGPAGPYLTHGELRERAAAAETGRDAPAHELCAGGRR